jgi:hypothetical protein
MIPALIVAVASMVGAIIAAIGAVLSHQEMDDRNRRLCVFGVVAGIVATLLSVCLNPEIIQPTLKCLAFILAILAIGIATKVTGIATKVTGIATKVTRAVVHLRRRRHHQNAGSGTGDFAAVDIATCRRAPADRD